jgi:serine/threonine-protein kinase
MLSVKLVAAPAPGTVIGGKYRVERLLGSGGMGAVVAARHVELQQPVAIKVLLPAVAKTEEANVRFLREGRAAAKLTSPYVAKVFDSGRLPSGEPYLVMELLGGRDLRSHLHEVRRVPLAQAVEWVLQAAHALGEAHAHHIVHRDVKPANLFLAETSAGTIVKVLDFGVAKHLEDEGADLTNTASVVGTPRYMAPEQMRSARLADRRGDIWSLGVVLYELVTGESPFRGDTVTALCFDVMERTPQPASHFNAELPPTFDALVARCLAKDPDDRFASMESLAAALRPFAPDARASLPFLPSNVPLPAPSAHHHRPPPHATWPCLRGRLARRRRRRARRRRGRRSRRRTRPARWPTRGRVRGPRRARSRGGRR